ncbi:hypothetical protein [Paraburkholderia antibiotica]|uniref:Uncharacterized protein n=1 Tax=Paraburkholderia antibiotica TaxID=2728839 RepID=A0A7Y0A037_9BURK|nr:hypothetical protein [Paraburkholderia antibiotica]NML34034.1 hypothetical protein [Paraburkholderia antibiotica]
MSQFGNVGVANFNDDREQILCDAVCRNRTRETINGAYNVFITCMVAAIDKRVTEDFVPHTREARYVAGRSDDSLDSRELNR